MSGPKVDYAKLREQEMARLAEATISKRTHEKTLVFSHALALCSFLA